MPYAPARRPGRTHQRPRSIPPAVGGRSPRRRRDPRNTARIGRVPDDRCRMARQTPAQESANRGRRRVGPEAGSRGPWRIERRDREGRRGDALSGRQRRAGRARLTMTTFSRGTSIDQMRSVADPWQQRASPPQGRGVARLSEPRSGHRISSTSALREDDQSGQSKARASTVDDLACPEGETSTNTRVPLGISARTFCAPKRVARGKGGSEGSHASTDHPRSAGPPPSAVVGGRRSGVESSRHDEHSDASNQGASLTLPSKAAAAACDSSEVTRI